MRLKNIETMINDQIMSLKWSRQFYEESVTVAVLVYLWLYGNFTVWVGRAEQQSPAALHEICNTHH